MFSQNTSKTIATNLACYPWCEHDLDVKGRLTRGNFTNFTHENFAILQ